MTVDTALLASLAVQANGDPVALKALRDRLLELDQWEALWQGEPASARRQTERELSRHLSRRHCHLLADDLHMRMCKAGVLDWGTHRETAAARRYYPALAEIALETVPVVEGAVRLDKDRSKVARGLLKRLGLGDVRVTYRAAILLGRVELRVPLDRSRRVPREEYDAADEKLLAICHQAFPSHRNASYPDTGYVNVAWRVDSRWS